MIELPARVGLVGCGIIGKHYAEGSRAFDSFEIVACSDVNTAAAKELAGENGIEVATLEELIADASIDLVLNLTPPAAHAPIIRQTLEAGKHVYTEKPFAATFEEGVELLAEADRLGLLVGCAPDTFLGSAYRKAETLIADGEIGEPIAATARILTGGPESWHPNADFFYRPGGGPLLDMGPYYLTAIAALLGSFTAVAGFSATLTPERRLVVGPRAGERFPVDVETHVGAVLQLARGGFATLIASFEARDQYESVLVLNGSRGVLALPDANAFGGEVRLKHGRGDWRTFSYPPAARETRGIGLHEMLEAAADGRPHRASGTLGLHVLEAATAILRSAQEGRAIELQTSLEAQPR